MIPAHSKNNLVILILKRIKTSLGVVLYYTVILVSVTQTIYKSQLSITYNNSSIFCSIPPLLFHVAICRAVLLPRIYWVVGVLGVGPQLRIRHHLRTYQRRYTGARRLGETLSMRSRKVQVSDGMLQPSKVLWSLRAWGPQWKIIYLFSYFLTSLYIYLDMD